MSKPRLGLGLVWVVLVCGCGDSAEEECKDLLGALCKRAIVCAEELTDSMAPEDFESGCVEQVEQSAGVCENAVDVSASYDTCIDEIEDASCDDFLSIDEVGVASIGLPAACRGVIKVDD